RAHHAPADRDRRPVSERALAAPESRYRAAHSQGAALRDRGEEATRGAGRAERPEEGERVRQPDPFLHVSSLSADQGPPHRARGGERRGRDGWRARHVHQGVPALGARTVTLDDENDKIRQSWVKYEEMRRRVLVA